MSESNDDLPVFTVPRSKWYRGKDSPGSYLLRNDGRRCCLGHVGGQCGIADPLLYRVATPPGVPSEFEKFPDGLRDGDGSSSVCRDMMIVNDSKGIADTDRESQLQALAIKAGFKLVFVDDEVTNG